MSIAEIRQHVGDFERALGDDPGASWGLAIAITLVILLFGAILFDTLLQRKRAREKVKAVERLHKYLDSLPSSKS